MVLLHYSIHEQTDALLLRLAEEDARAFHREPAARHLRDEVVATPTLEATVVDKYALILGEDCEVIDRTSNLRAPVFPASLCPEHHAAGTRSVLFLQQLADVSLRVAVVYEDTAEHTPAAFVVGIAHRDVDASTWRSTAIAVPLALLAALLIVNALGLAIKPAARELEELSDAVGLLERPDPIGALTRARDAIERSPHTSAEVAVLRDALQVALQELQDAAEWQSRFIAEAAHELRTPITVIRGELEVTLRRERSVEAYKEALERVLTSAVRLQELTAHLLEGAHYEATGASSAPTDLREALQDAAHTHAERARAQEVTLHGPPTGAPALAHADPQLVTRTLDNLIENVLQHASARTLWLELDGDETHLRIRVRDDGRGIPDDVSLTLFDPFGKSIESDGTGLGLYLVHTLMRAQRGEAAWFQTSQTHTVFELRFRRAAGPDA